MTVSVSVSEAVTVTGRRERVNVVSRDVLTEIG